IRSNESSCATPVEVVSDGHAIRELADLRLGTVHNLGDRVRLNVIPCMQDKAFIAVDRPPTVSHGTKEIVFWIKGFTCFPGRPRKLHSSDLQRLNKRLPKLLWVTIRNGSCE